MSSTYTLKKNTQNKSKANETIAQHTQTLNWQEPEDIKTSKIS